MFNAGMRSSPPPDIMGTYSATFVPTTYYRGSPTGASNTQPYLGFDTLNTSRNLMGTSLLGTTSPPRRRYSIGGFPSASITEYLNLMQSANESAHLSNLLNETSKSITRSSQILGVSSETSALPGYEAVLAGQFGDTCTDTGAFQSDNLITMPLANYSSQPNIYSLPNNYTSTSAFYEPTASSYLSHQKSFANFPSYSRPTHNVSFTHPLATASSSYIAPHRPCSNLGPYQSALSTSRQNLFMPTHHTSNPALSSGAHNTWIPSSHSRLLGTTIDPYSNTSHYQPLPSSSLLGSNNPNTQPYLDLPDHHHHHHHHSINNTNIPFSSSTVGGGGYANQHFDHHYYQTPLQQQNQQQLAKLDLEYSKQGETQKRQVSFKFDVDNLSVDS